MAGLNKCRIWSQGNRFITDRVGNIELLQNVGEFLDQTKLVFYAY